MNARGPAVCSVDGCGKGGKIRRGWCEKHYKRWQAHGDPLIVWSRDTRKPSKRRDPVERFWSHVDKSAGQDDCWLWTGSQIGGNGPGDRYGGFTAAPGVSVYAHRFVYELTVGPIPPGLEIDHICHTKLCVRPDHLRLATHKQNHENRLDRGKTSRSASGIRGVSWHRRERRWKVTAKHNGHEVYGGVFTDLARAEQAAIALRNRLFTHNDADRLAELDRTGQNPRVV